jgi:hypothetical protein
MPLDIFQKLTKISVRVHKSLSLYCQTSNAKMYQTVAIYKVITGSTHNNSQVYWRVWVKSVQKNTLRSTFVLSVLIRQVKFTLILIIGNYI